MGGAEQAGAAKGGYKAAAANRHTHAATILLRCWLETFTFPILDDTDPILRMISQNRALCPSNMSLFGVTRSRLANRLALTCHHSASQTSDMAQTYLLFDFGSDEAKVQQARHKLESWKQAFRLDKKLQYKLEREQSASPEPQPAPTAEPAKSEKAQPSASKAKAKAKPKSKSSDAPHAETENHRDVKLFVRLYFSGPEKLSEQRWLDPIPAEEPFNSASPKIVSES